MAGLQQHFPFDIAENYAYDNSKISVENSNAKLKLLTTNVDTVQDFSNDSGFDYDNTVTRISSGKMRQKDIFGGTFYASYFDNLNGTYADGDLTATKIGDVSILNNRAVFGAGTDNYLEYNASQNARKLRSKGCVRFTFTPFYLGSGSGQRFFAISAGENDIRNLVRMIHINSTLRYDIYDSSGNPIKTVQTGNVFSPSANQSYEIELNFNVSLGEYRLFIDGININGLQTSSPATRSNSINLFRVGKGFLSNQSVSINGAISDFQLFDNVQHTSNYTITPPPPTRYFADTIILPNFTYTGLGFFQKINSITTIESGNVRYSIELNNSGVILYYDNNTWSQSDNTYSQSNTIAEINNNISTLILSDTNVITIRIYFDSSNVLATIDNLIINTNNDTTYSTIPVTIRPKSFLVTNQLCGISAQYDDSNNNDVRISINSDGIEMYYNTVSMMWEPNNSDFTKTNLLTELTDEIMKQLVVTTLARPIVHLKSNNGLTTSSIDSLSICFLYNPMDISLEKVGVYGFLFGSNGEPIENAKIYVRQISSLFPDVEITNENAVLTNKDSVFTTSLTGEFVAMVVNGFKYRFAFEVGDNKKYYKYVDVNTTANTIAIKDL